MDGGRSAPGEFPDDEEPRPYDAPPPSGDDALPPGVFDDSGQLQGEGFARAPTAGRFDISSLAVLVPALALLPVSWVVIYPLYRLVALAVDLPSYPVVYAGYLVLGLLTFLQPVQRLLLAGLFGARQPTPSELAELRPSWDAVLRRANITDDPYLLVVIDSHDLNAAATGGSVVTVTTGAINGLPPDELQGALAHELGHHLGAHSVGLPLAHWLATPMAWLGEVGSRLSRISCLFTLGCIVLLIFGAGFLGIVFGMAAALVGVILLVAGRIAGSLGRLVGRFSEYGADRAAVDLGFGPPLAAALDQFSRLGTPETAGSTVGQRIFGSHPPLIRRLGRVRARMAHRGEG